MSAATDQPAPRCLFCAEGHVYPRPLLLQFDALAVILLIVITAAVGLAFLLRSAWLALVALPPLAFLARFNRIMYACDRCGVWIEASDAYRPRHWTADDYSDHYSGPTAAG